MARDPDDPRRGGRRRGDRARRPPPHEEISPAARELARAFGESARSASLATSLVAHGAPQFTVSPAVARAARTRPYEPRPGDPPLRALRVLARPGGTLVATVRVPWEPLRPGPTGSTLEVALIDDTGTPVDLESPQPVAYAGFAPVPGDPRYTAQLCYAAAWGTWHRWRTAVGRDPSWGFDTEPTDVAPEPLRLRIAAAAAGGARYDAAAGLVEAGLGDGALQQALDGGRAPTPAHDDVARATSRAILHGLRPHLALACNPDAPALRDALAELAAVLQRASWRECARAALGEAVQELRQDGGGAGDVPPLVDLGRRLARALDPASGSEAEWRDGPRSAPRAALLVAAVWESFAAVWARRAAPLVRIATGTEALLPAAASDALLDALAAAASATASHLLAISLRAVDYLPPVDATFGDWLRAAVTADRELVPDDRWRYREALVAGCERLGIAPHHAGVADTEALAWPAPARATPPLRGIDFATAQFAGDPAHAPDAEELERQGTVLGRMVAHAQWCELFGLADPTRADHRVRLAGDEVSLPCVESVRTARRSGPNGRIVFEVVAEVTQRRIAHGRDGGPAVEVLGGATIVAGPSGELRWVVARSLLDDDRVQRQRAWALGEGARGYTGGDDGVLRAVGEEVGIAEEAW